MRTQHFPKNKHLVRAVREKCRSEISEHVVTPAETERGIKGNVPKIAITVQTTSLMSLYLHA